MKKAGSMNLWMLVTKGWDSVLGYWNETFREEQEEKKKTIAEGKLERKSAKNRRLNINILIMLVIKYQILFDVCIKYLRTPINQILQLWCYQINLLLPNLNQTKLCHNFRHFSFFFVLLSSSIPDNFLSNRNFSWAFFAASGFLEGLPDPE